MAQKTIWSNPADERVAREIIAKDGHSIAEAARMISERIGVPVSYSQIADKRIALRNEGSPVGSLIVRKAIEPQVRQPKDCVEHRTLKIGVVRRRADLTVLGTPTLVEGLISLPRISILDGASA